MKEKIIYVADDGAEFESEDECREYEVFDELHPCFEKVQLWDDCEDLIPTPSNYEEMLEALQTMSYARGDVEAFIDAVYNLDLESEMLDYGSFRNEAYGIDPGNLLMYDNDIDCWVNVNDMYRQYRDILKNFSVI